MAAVAVSVAILVGGNPFRIGRAASYENLDAMETALGELIADPKYTEDSTKSAENFIGGSFRDEVWRKV